MKIYTKKGDQGETSLFGGQRVKKNHPRVNAYGTLDETNSMLGLALSYIPEKEAVVRNRLIRIQNALFQMGSEIASTKTLPPHLTLVQAKDIEQLEQEIDEMEASLQPLKRFILPGGSPAGATLHVVRTLVRKAERLVVEFSEPIALRPEVLQYLNRLSDYFFVCARYVNWITHQPETEWKP